MSIQVPPRGGYFVNIVSIILLFSATFKYQSIFNEIIGKLWNFLSSQYEQKLGE